MKKNTMNDLWVHYKEWEMRCFSAFRFSWLFDFTARFKSREDKHFKEENTAAHINVMHKKKRLTSEKY